MDESSPPVSAEPAAKATRWSLVALGVSAVVAVAAIIATVGLVSGPRPDATLHPSGVEPDEQLITLMAAEATELDLGIPAGFGSEMHIDLSTLRGFGTYRDIELWSAENAFGSTCLIAIHRETIDVVARECVPPGVDLFVDTMFHGLENGERLRFFLRGDTVDAYHLVPEEAD